MNESRTLHIGYRRMGIDIWCVSLHTNESRIHTYEWVTNSTHWVSKNGYRHMMCISTYEWVTNSHIWMSHELYTLGIEEWVRPTQSVMYVPLLVNRFAASVLLIVQYRYLKSCSGDFYSPESDPPHKIMRYWFYCSLLLGFSFPPDRICQVEMVCIGGVPVSKRHFGGAGP